MGKQLSATQITKENQIYDEFIEIPVTMGEEEYEVKLFPYFSQVKIRDLVNEMIEFFQASEKENANIDPLDEDDLVGYFILKYATDIKFTKSKKAKTIYKEFKGVRKGTLFQTFLEHIPEETIGNVYDRIFKVIEASTSLENQFKQLQNTYKNLELENRDVIENTFKKSKDTPVN